MIKSASSQLITEITKARNTYGEEANWITDEVKFRHDPSLQDKILAEIEYACTTVTALIESVVSGFFIILALPYTLISTEPLKKSVEWLESSSFAFIWSIGYLVCNWIFPHLLTREDYSRNFVFRGDYENIESWPSAPLTSSLFMLAREMPDYLSTAYKLRFSNITEESGWWDQLCGKLSRYKQLISEVLQMGGYQGLFRRNAQRLTTDFATLNREVAKTNRAICAYFVSSNDTNGAILGNHLVYYHHYKIGNLQKHFDVSAKVVHSTAEMFAHLRHLKETYPTRPIRVVDIVAHGNSQNIIINSETSDSGDYSRDSVQENGFRDCAPDAAIILDACSTGDGRNSIAKEIALKNRGKRVFAPASSLFFSKPSFKSREGITEVDHVTHGLAYVNAYTSRQFHYA